MTIQELYDMAAKANMIDAHLRICDAMAVSFYPESSNVLLSRRDSEIAIDVSGLEVVEYDELDQWRLARTEPQNKD